MKEVPQHVAIILDGNGRWAKSKGMPRSYGHTIGAKNVEPICRAADSLGIKYLTMYVFSTENWNRSEDEVHALMKLLDAYMKNCLSLASNNNMRVRVLGDISKLDSSLQKKIKILEDETADFTGLSFQIALNYGSRDEMVRAMRKMYLDLPDKSELHDISLEQYINESVFQNYLDAPDIPDPDLLIRTSGEQRLSNFLLWQLAYAEFYFTDTPWPEFHEKQLEEAVEEYMNRDRRYGKV